MEKNHSQNTQPITGSVKDLGNEVNSFPIRNRKLKRLLSLIAGIMLILISIVGFFYLTILTLDRVQIHGWAIMATILPFYLLLLLMMLPLGFLLICFAKRHWNDGITVFEQGFVRQRKRKTQTWLWTDIEQLDTRVISSVFGGSEVNSQVKILIEADNHRTLNIPNRYERMTELAQEIRNNTLPVLTQKFLPRLTQKEQFVFHKNLELDQKGIGYNGKQLDWDEINAVETQSGMLTFTAKDRTKIPVKIPINQIKNLDLLLFLMHNPSFREYLSP